MTADPRAALSDLVAALERHLEVCATGRGDDDPALTAASDQVVEAFESYDEALVDTYGIDTPLAVYDEDYDDEDEYDTSDDESDDEDSDDEDYDDEEDEDGYTGLDDEEFDVDERPRG